MAASSTASNIFFGASLLVICLLVLLILRHYVPLRSTPSYITLPVFLALALPASIVLLVPIDLASSTGEESGSSRGIWLPERAILVAWRISYWLTFVLTWFVLPILGEYVDAGHRDPKGRLLYSLRSNAKFYAIVGICAIGGLVYFIISYGFAITSLKALVMALAYAFGLVLAIYLMGHGLVALPRKLYRNASIAGRLKSLQTHAPRTHERMTEALEELDLLESQVLQLKQRKDGTAREYRDWIEELADTSDLPESRVGHTPVTQSSSSTIPAVITERYLADLTRKLKRARHKRIRFVVEWDRLVQEAADTQAILDASGSKKLEFGRSSPTASWIDRMSFITPNMRYHLHANVYPALRLALSGILAIASACIIWSEIFSSIVPKISVVGLSIIHHPSSENGKIGFAGQVMAAFWLLYMCTAALISIQEVKVWGNRALVRRHTYAESACWYAMQVAKLTVPLSYNFITFVPKDIFERTSFYKFLGQLINLTPLGTGFSAFFPIFILLPVLATAFNLYGRIRSFAGFGVLEDESDENPSGYGTGGWREGRALIDRELQGNNDDFGLSSRDESPRPRAPIMPASQTQRLLDTSPSLSPNRATTSPRPRSPAQPNNRQTLPPSSSRPADNSSDPADDGNIFDVFAHRVKNTFETTDFQFKRPKWMGGVDGNDEGSGRADFGRGLGRWFGGRPNDGQVRI